MLKKNSLDCIMRVGALSGPARLHLQKHICSKRVVALQGDLEEQGVFKLHGYYIPVAGSEGLIGVQGHGQAQLQ